MTARTAIKIPPQSDAQSWLDARRVSATDAVVRQVAKHIPVEVNPWEVATNIVNDLRAIGLLK